MNERPFFILSQTGEGKGHKYWSRKIDKMVQKSYNQH